LVVVAVVLLALNKYFSGSSYNEVKPNLWGSVAVITGGNTGIGRETAQDLAQQGCRVIIGARDTHKSKAFVREVNGLVGKEMVEQL
jgi:NAD(P)-dependent dehydrogenase (short-subunit alcohol dehydrogenase family)